MKVKYIVKENGKFVIKDEKFLPPLKEFETKEQAIEYIKKQHLEVEEKFEVQLQQDNGEFRPLNIEEDSSIDATSVLTETPPIEPEAKVVDTPIIDETTPPIVEEETPKVEEETPKVEEETPKVEEETPKVEEETPKVEEETSKVEEETPIVSSSEPVVTPDIVEPTPEPTPEVEVAVATATPVTETATAVQPVDESSEGDATKTEDASKTMNVETSEISEGESTKTKSKFDVKMIWTNPEYRKWLYLGIAVLIEVAIIIAIIVLIAQ